MRLTKTKPQIIENKEVVKLFSSQVEYEVKTAKGELKYSGPKFNPEMWHQIMSFFRWTNKEMQSESQVRLYVNTKLGRWGAWAFPQAGRTGMNARELPVIESPDQARERFASWDSLPSDDWLYFGTVHHHCSSSAFQSATDEQNEWNQDGLHITVGNMDADRHDLHARLYLGGNCFDPDMSLFWQINPELAEQIPSEMLDELACYQMCGKVTVDFPDSWRKNIIETQRAPHHSKAERRWDLDEPAGWPLMHRLEAAVEDISRSCEFSSIADDQCIAALTMLANGETERVIVEACVKHGVTPDEILEAMEEFAPEDRFAGL